ncbi:MAG: sigma-54-dependent Fis family transcriptional regulator [Myxococcales bacterium]|nr:sigma-54-dependent Fis family transcriptional regulator [Myxococcales bacterium]
MRGRLLVVDDEPGVRFALKVVLEDADFEVEQAADGVAALERLDADPSIDLALVDVSMPRLGGLELLDRLSVRQGAPPVIILTARGSERLAVEALKRGAIDYFAKPFDEDELLRVVMRNVVTSRLHGEVSRLRAALSLGRTMVFESQAMARVAQMVERVAGRDVPILITGETGSGKELVARALVAASKRADKPLFTLNCGGLTDELATAELFGHTKGAFSGAIRERPGLFVAADGGTLLLDEVGELSPRVQSALLRVLQEGTVRPVGRDESRSVNVRVLAATHRDLARDPGFREDLYYRLRVVEIRVPPLRERPEDIIPLARHFANRAADRMELGPMRLAPALERTLVAQPWPGNVRQLEHVVHALVALSHEAEIGLDVWALANDSSAPVRPGGTLKARVDHFEAGLLREVLDACGGNRSEAARQLQVSRMTLVSKLKKHGLD